MKKYFNGFTLAEVLITLGIIGVVAALTIPTLMANYRKTQYASQLKIFYSTMNQALANMSLDEGCPHNLGCTDIFANNHQTVGDKITKYFNVTKNCGVTTNQDCFGNSYFINYDSTIGGNALASQVATPNSSSYYKFISANGMSILIYTTGTNCTIDWRLNGVGPAIQCGWTMVDTNGPKPPNTIGRDTFSFTIAKNATLIPEGNSYSTRLSYLNGNLLNGAWNPTAAIYWKDRGCNPGKSYDKAGWLCAARIVEEGWQMNY